MSNTLIDNKIYNWIQQYPDRFAILMLLIFASITRWFMLGHPNSAVFDEVHFNYFAGFYYTGQYYYDIHPPLGKLLLALSALPSGGIAPEDIVRTISTPYPSDTYMAMRSLPAFIGTCLPVIIFLIARTLNMSLASAIVAGAFIVLDNAYLIQSKLILLDSMLLFFGFSSLYLFLLYRKKQHWGLLVSSAILAGCSISIKWIGVSFLGLIGLVMIIDWIKLLWAKGWNITPALKGKLFILITAATYTSVFYIHFNLLPISHHQGDQFMTLGFQATLKGSRYYGAKSLISQFSCPPNYRHSLGINTPDTEVKTSEKLACQISFTEIEKPNFWQKLVELNRTMYFTNQGLSQSHPDASKWYTWPLMSKPLYYWYNNGARIYLLGNLAVWWLSALAVIALIVGQLKFNLGLRKEAFWILMTGFSANLLPFAMVNRVMFMYHYLTSLCFAILLLAFFIDQLPNKNRWAVGLITLAGGIFLLITPLTYGVNWYGSDLLWFLRFFGWHP